MFSSAFGSVLAVEEDRIAGRSGCTLDELDAYLDDVIDEVCGI